MKLDIIASLVTLCLGDQDYPTNHNVDHEYSEYN